MAMLLDMELTDEILIEVFCFLGIIFLYFCFF